METNFNFWCVLFVYYLPFANSLFSQDIFPRRSRPPIDGSWSSWQSWSACYKNVRNNTRTQTAFFPLWENFYIQSRNRTCTSPKPLFGGKECDPPSHRFRQCSCMNPLLGKDRINDSFLSSSSYLDGYPAREVRFTNSSVGWCAKSKGSFWTETYLQINFENFTNVGAISTIDNMKGRVTRYKLKYSLNGNTWNYVRKDGNNLVFTGNYFHGKRKKNNFSTQLVMRYLRVIPVQSFGLPCLKVEVYGCVFTCGRKLTAPYGELVAQSSEIHDQNCLWRVEVRNTTSLTFVFSIFYVLCEEGHLDILDGVLPYANARLLRRICLKDGDVAIPNLTLNRNSLWVKFVSNSSLNEVSFNIKYLAKCSQTIQLIKGEPVHIKSPNYPGNYFDNLNCSWTLTPPSGLKKVEIHINEFNVESSTTTESSSNKCSDDVVIIDTEHYGGIKQKFASYCNNKQPPRKIILSADKIIISFQSDPYVGATNNNKGFSFSVISGHKDILPTLQGNEAKKSQVGTGKPGQRRNRNDNGSNVTYKRKVKPAKDDTWTVIIVCTFTSLVIVLIGTVVYLNCRRFINSRNELSAQCAKAAEENRQKKNKVQKQKYLRERNTLITPPSSPAKIVDDDPAENFALLATTEGNISENSKPVETNDHIKRVHSELDVHNEIMHSPDQVDGGEESSSSGASSEMSSPVKSMVVNCGSLSNEEVDESVI